MVFLSIECFASHNFLKTFMVFDEHRKIGIPVTWNIFASTIMWIFNYG
jgi:hypothetical protein